MRRASGPYFMTTLSSKLTLNIEPLRQFKAEVARGIRSGSGEIGKVYRKWAVRYRGYIQERFDRFSKGGGDWAPLKSRDGSILRDTNTLFAALNPVFTGNAGALERIVAGGILVGFGGSATHANGDATVAQIAAWHNEGAGFNPQRTIIVDADRALIRDFTKDMETGLERIRKNVDS